MPKKLTSDFDAFRQLLKRILEGTSFVTSHLIHVPIMEDYETDISLPDRLKFCKLSLDMRSRRVEITSRYPLFTIRLSNPPRDEQVRRVREHIEDVHYSLKADLPDQYKSLY